MRMMNIAATTLGQLQKQLDVISNNIANVDTTGFKKSDTSFGSLLSQQINNGPVEAEDDVSIRNTPYGIRVGTGAYVNGVALDYSQGGVKATGRELDVALTNERHFFQVQVEENGRTETMYSRDGAFQLATTTNTEYLALTNGEGYPIIGENGLIFVPANAKEIKIMENGEILVTRADGTQVTERISVIEMTQPQVLENEGGNLYRLSNTAALTAPIAQLVRTVETKNVKLLVGSLEGSNVEMSSEMSKMIETQRAYQFSSRAVSMSDQMMGLVNNLRS